MEFGEAIDDLSHDIDVINSTKADISNFDDYIKNNKQIFDQISDTLKSPDMKVEISGTPGDYRVTFDGKAVDLDGAKTDLENGDVLESMKKLGADDATLNDPTIQQFAKDYKQTWSQQVSVQDRVNLESSKTKGEEFTKKYGEPTSADDFEQKVNNNSEVAKEIKPKTEDIAEKAKTGKPVEVGKWVKRTLIGLGITFGLAELYSLIKQHQNEMNGCWLIKTSDGTKCKIGLLTCSDGARTTGTICDPGAYQNCMDVCTLKKTATCFSSTTCLSCNTDHTTCATKLTQCTGNDPCNEQCDSSKISVPDGYRLQCVNVDFWGAADDFFKGLLNTPSTVLSSIIAVLIKILIIVGIIVGVFILGKVGFYVYNNWKEKKSSYEY